jgi:hypothetical protein
VSSPYTLIFSTVVAAADILHVADIAIPVLAPLNQDLGVAFDEGIVSSLESTSFRVMFSKAVTPWQSPCGPDCSYTFSFLGPAYQCANLGPFESTGINLTEIQDSGNPGGTEPPPFVNGSLVYYGVLDAGNETRPCGLLVLYDELTRTIQCDLYNATYTAAVSYSANVQTIQKNLEFHNPITNGGEMYDSMITSLDNGTPLDFWGPLNIFLLQNVAVHGLTGFIAVMGTGEQEAINTGSNVAFWPGVDIFTPGAVKASNLSQTINFVDLATNLEDLLAIIHSAFSVYLSPPPIYRLFEFKRTSRQV